LADVGEETGLGGASCSRQPVVAADGRGDPLALGEFNAAVLRFGSTGRYVNRFGSAWN